MGTNELSDGVPKICLKMAIAGVFIALLAIKNIVNLRIIPSSSPSFEGVARSDGVACSAAKNYPARWAPLLKKGNFLPLVFIPLL